MCLSNSLFHLQCIDSVIYLLYKLEDFGLGRLYLGKVAVSQADWHIHMGESFQDYS